MILDNLIKVEYKRISRMRIIQSGYVYQVKNFAGNGYQEIKFNRRRYDGSYSEGTTVEELLRVLRDKFYHFQSKVPSQHNTLCIEAIEACITACLLRLAEKKEILNNKE